MERKRGQIDLSFGLIFSVILIIAFLGFAVYAIINFLGMKDKIEVGKFIDELQGDVDTAWKSSQTLDDFSYFLPVNIKEVCFIDESKAGKGGKADIYTELKNRLAKEANMIFYPLGSSKAIYSKRIEHIDIANITKTNNPFCIQNKNGKLNLTLQQDFGGTNLVLIK